MEGSNKASPDDIENPRVPLLMASSMSADLAMASSMSEDEDLTMASWAITLPPLFSPRIPRDPTVTSPDDIEDPHVPLLATKIREELDNLSSVSSPCCIFRVPERLRYLNEKAYEPRVVSIGPLHYYKEASEAMEEPDEKQTKKRATEEHKKRYLQHFLNRTPEISLEKFLKKIKGQEAKIRSCYAEPIEINSDDFVKLILIDATFILELLLRSYFSEYGQEGDRIFNIPLMIYDIWPDILLLENQLPFFIFEELLDLHNTEAEEPVSIGTLSLNFFRGLLNVEKAKKHILETVGSSLAQADHFVDFIMRQLCLPFKTRVAGEFNGTRSITNLHQAGVKFQVVPNKTHLFGLDIQYTDGVLKIPMITIQDSTEVIIRNLVAFEQCYAIDNHITDYVIMMDRLVNTPEDVDLLVESGIIQNMLGDSAAVSTLINALANGVSVDPSKFFYAAVCDDLNKHYGKSCNKWKANLRQNYFNTPWAIISLSAATFLIILTIIQTVCSIIAL